ncbi:lactate utilization protein [Thalassotalea fonticola]|uniref:Lactate utilization protein n=1 Tax=Thalassotalea fonticola TaxID=3065649 RepID=A0ABZ0GRX0_9GAMM|nr:lactate utilization protein [Colwelliaceae bacterium S1-1]
MSTDYQIKSNAARSSIINKLKKEVAGADYDKLPEELSYQYQQLSKTQQVEQFIGHLEANHAQVIKLEKQQIPQVVSEQLKQRGIRTLLYGMQAPHSAQMAELDSYIHAEVFDFNLAENKEKLFNQTPAGITSSRAAIAATGSIVLWPTETEPRSLSLVPPVHMVIVDAEQLYANFSSLIREQQWQDNLPTNAILISGPSKTADIQQTLAYGAHGPKELLVLLLNA